MSRIRLAAPPSGRTSPYRTTRLSRLLSVDVAVVGAGITGITAAVLLKRAGKTVALLESKRIVHGATGYTTAKVTSGHGLGYTKIKQAFGEDGTRVYAEANQAGLERIARFVEEDGIDCDFERKDNYAYADDEQQAKQVEQEVESPNPRTACFVVRDTPRPSRSPPRYAETSPSSTAQVPPRPRRTIPGDGSHVFESSRVLSVKNGGQCEVVAQQGRVRARDVVVATHLPILDRGLFFAKTYPHLSYALCAPIDESEAPDGMFINAGTPTRSMRTLRDGDRLLLNVGGNGHSRRRGHAAKTTSEDFSTSNGRARRVRVPLVEHDYMPPPGPYFGASPADAPRYTSYGLHQLGNERTAAAE